MLSQSSTLSNPLAVLSVDYFFVEFVFFFNFKLFTFES
jgi:hypothetical protein